MAFPLGHPMGNPFDRELQRQVLTEGLRHLVKITEPGMIADLTEIYYIEGGKCTLCTVEVG